METSPYGAGSGSVGGWWGAGKTVISLITTMIWLQLGDDKLLLVVLHRSIIRWRRSTVAELWV